MYFTIRHGEDGFYIDKIQNIDEFLIECAEEEQEFLGDFPEDRWNKKRESMDRQNWPDEKEIILIKGEIVVPKTVNVVKEYRVE